MEHMLSLFVRSIFVDNMIFAFFLGMCSYLAVSKNVKTALGLGVAVTFVLCVTVPVDYLLQTKVLAEDGILGMDLSYLAFILFIAVIAGMVQLVEMVVERFFSFALCRIGYLPPFDCRELRHHGCLTVHAAENFHGSGHQHAGYLQRMGFLGIRFGFRYRLAVGHCVFGCHP